MYSLGRINWLYASFLVITHLVGIIGTVLLAIHGLIYWQTLVLLIVFVYLIGMGITAGYHRLCSHNSYEAHPVIRLILVLLGAGAFQGTVLEWCTDHRNHHRYTDTDKDPYNIKKGFWYAHMGWLLVFDTRKRDYSNVTDLMYDPIVRFQHKYYPFIAILMCFGPATLIATLWGDALGGFVIGSVLRCVVNHHLTFSVNSVCHKFGKASYSDKQSGKDHWITALFTLGEGFHNFHHQFPIDYRNGIRFYHFDPTKWIIYGLSMIGLTSDLKRVDESRILRYKKKHSIKSA